MLFEAVVSALAAVLGTDIVTAGLILGLVSTIALTVSIAWAFGENMGELSIIMGGGIGMVFSVLVGWWPVWTVIFIGLLIVFVIVNPWGIGHER